jgi:hypothetical protein
MAAEASTAPPALSSYGQVGCKSRYWGTSEVQCARCGRRVSRASGEGPRSAPRPCLCLGWRWRWT